MNCLNQAHLSPLNLNDNDKDEELGRYSNIDLIFDTKAIVVLSCLLPLLRICQLCFSRAKITKFMLRTNNLIVKQKCSKGHISKFLNLSSAILFTGNTYTRSKQFMKVANTYFFSERTFMKLQTMVSFPSVNKVYKMARNKIIGTLLNCSVNVVGDGYCDFFGFNVKYGTYTLMNVQINLILDFDIVQVSTVGNSSQMEKEGLKQLME